MSQQQQSGNKESPSDWERQVYLGTDISHDFTLMMDNPWPTVAEIRIYVSQKFVTTERHDAMLDYLNDLEERGMEPSDEPGFLSTFRDLAAKEFLIFRQTVKDLTALALSKDTSDVGRIPRTFVCDEMFIIGCEPGGTGVIYGVPGSGKSNIAVAEIYRTSVLQPNWEVDINIPVQDIPPNAKFNGTLSGTLLHGAEFARSMLERGERNFMIMWINDEAQLSRDRQRSGSKENIAMKQINLVARMFGFFQYSILQQNRPPVEVADFATHYIEKPSRKYPDRATLRMTGKARYTCNMSLGGIPSAEERGLLYEDRTKLTYKVDINPLRLFDYVSGIADTTGRIDTVAQYDATIEYINKHRGEKLDIINDDIIAAILYRMRERHIAKNPGAVSYAKLGFLVGWPESTTRFRLKQYEESVKEGRVILDEDPEDVARGLSGAVLPLAEPAKESGGIEPSSSN